MYTFLARKYLRFLLLYCKLCYIKKLSNVVNSMYNDHILYLGNGWWDVCKHNVIFKGLSMENNPP
jgi:hypothetical protein